MPPHTRLKRVIAEMPSEGGYALLDAACGTGGLLYLARDRYAHLVGVDLVEDNLRQVQRVATAAATPIETHKLDLDADRLPWEDQSFDTVAAVAVLEFVFDPSGVVAEMSRVLKENGTFIVQVGNIAAIRNRIRLLFGSIPWTTQFQGAVNGGALHFFTAKTLQEILLTAGIDRIKHTCGGRLYQVTRLLPSFLGSDIILIGKKSNRADPR